MSGDEGHRGPGKRGNTAPHRPARGADAGWVPDPTSQAPGKPCEAGNSGTMPRNLKPCNITLFSFSKHSNLALQGPLYGFCSRHWIAAQTPLQCRAFCPSCCECRQQTSAVSPFRNDLSGRELPGPGACLLGVQRPTSRDCLMRQQEAWPVPTTRRPVLVHPLVQSSMPGQQRKPSGQHHRWTSSPVQLCALLLCTGLILRARLKKKKKRTCTLIFMSAPAFWETQPVTLLHVTMPPPRAGGTMCLHKHLLKIFTPVTTNTSRRRRSLGHKWTRFFGKFPNLLI